MTVHQCVYFIITISFQKSLTSIINRFNISKSILFYRIILITHSFNFILLYILQYNNKIKKKIKKLNENFLLTIRETLF